MSEQPLSEQEVDTIQVQPEGRIVVTPLDQAMEQLRGSLQLVPVNKLTEPGPVVGFTLLTGDNGLTQLHHQYGPHPVGKYEIIDETEPEYTALSEEARQQIADDPILQKGVLRSDGWSWIESWSDKRVNASLREVFVAKSGDRKIDVFNASNSDLEAEQATDILDALRSVAAYTGGKIFDRVNMILLAPGEDFNKFDYGKQKQKMTVGDFQASAGIVRLNMDYFRSLEAGATFQRYTKFFPPEHRSSLLAIMLAHELGHAMDVRLAQEVSANDVRFVPADWQQSVKTKYSAFEKLAGWAAIQQPDGNYPAEGIDYANQDDSTECVPTEYGASSPQEDFAETFAIIAMGGDVVQLPERQRLLSLVINKAVGDSEIGPAKIVLEKVETNGTYPSTPNVAGLMLFRQNIADALAASAK